MKITYDWLKDHLKTKSNEAQLIEKLTAIGLEVESVDRKSTRQNPVTSLSRMPSSA